MGQCYRLAGVTKSYKGRQVCDVPSLEIDEGSFLVIMGPNGAGKSTLLRMLALVEQPDTGKLSFQANTLLPGGKIPLELRRRVTMVFQRPVFTTGTVEDAVGYGLRLRGEKHVVARTQDMLEALGIAHLVRAKVSTLSAGEAQRAALARAMLVEPDVLLLDEPTTSLDPDNVVLVEHLLRGLHTDKGKTMVLVTQSESQAKRLATQAAFMLDGSLVESEPVFDESKEHKPR